MNEPTGTEHRFASIDAVRGSLYRVQVVSDSATLSAYEAELDALAASCVEPNVFYEQWMLRPALDCFDTSNIRIVIVRHRDHGVTGVFPFELTPRFRGLPVRSLKSWRHPYCFLCTPLVSQVCARATLQALLDWLESPAAPAKMIELELVAGDGPFWELIEAQLRERPAWRFRTSSYERATFEPAVDAGASVSGRHRKELRRLERKLAEDHHCAYRVLGDDEPAQPWIDRFLVLEESGWKGREGTALASGAGSRRFFSTIAASAMHRGQLQMLAIEIDGLPIAMKCNFLSNGTAFAFKIAYDESYSAFSPGVLLELFNMRNFANQASVQRMDSCALPEHSMINRLWTGRRTIVTCQMASRGLGSVLIKQWSRFHGIRRWMNRSDSREDSSAH